MKFKIGSMIKYRGVRVTINHIVCIKGRQRVYFDYPTPGGARMKNAWNTDVRAA